MKDKELLLLANTARQEIIKMLLESKSGHTAGALGLAELYTVLYHDWANVDPTQPKSEERDFVFVSNGHTCPILYTTLASKGFFSKDELGHFRKINSLLQGHPHNTSIPGVENSGGPLGQGISQACGTALALKRDKKTNRVFCFTGDGELDEGQCWEAFMFAGDYDLSNLCVIVDRNHIQIDDFTDRDMPLEPLGDKFKSFNFNVMEIDGHDVGDIKKALAKADKETKKPSVIIANTVPGKGVKEMENKYSWHGKPPNEEEAKQALKDLAEERTRVEKKWF